MPRHRRRAPNRGERVLQSFAGRLMDRERQGNRKMNLIKTVHEAKRWEFTFSDTNDIFNNPLVTRIGEIPQGTAQDQRIGNKIRPTFIKTRFFVAMDDGSANAQGIYRILLLQYRSTRIANDADLNNLTPGTTAPERWEVDREQVTIVYDKLHVLNARTQSTGAGGYSGFRRKHELTFFPQKKRIMKNEWRFNDEAANPDRPFEGALYLVVIGSNTDINVDGGYHEMYYRDV